jgi:hypothetical protein
LRLPFGLILHAALVHVGERTDRIRHPQSVLAQTILVNVPSHIYLLAHLTYRMYLGTSHLDLGITLFNPFGGRFREAQGAMAQDGSNYGGELLGSRAMLTARLVY